MNLRIPKGLALDLGESVLDAGAGGAACPKVRDDAKGRVLPAGGVAAGSAVHVVGPGAAHRDVGFKAVEERVVLCVVALVVMLAQFMWSAATIPSAIAVAAIVVLWLAIELTFRLVDHKPTGA